MCGNNKRTLFRCALIGRTFLFYRGVDMSDVYTVSVFIDKSDDKEENSYIGGRFIPYFYNLMSTHKNVLFLVPFDFDVAQSVMRTIRNMLTLNPEFSACCRGVYSFGGTGVCELFCNENHTYGKAIFLKEDENITERQAKIKRNKKMVDISDLSLFYVTKRNGRIDSTMKYAKEKNKEFIKMK